MDPTCLKHIILSEKLGIDHTISHKHKGQYTTAFAKYVQYLVR